MKLWLDVDDLFYFARRSARPTGIQRLTGEVYGALVEQAPEIVGFVTHSPQPGLFSIVDWRDVQRIYRQMTEGNHERPSQAADTTDVDAGSSPGRARLVERLANLLRRQRLPATLTEPPSPKALDLRDVGAADDVLCALGAPWHDRNYAERVSALISTTGMRFAMLVHDLIPLVHREYFEAGRAPNFEKVMRGTLPLADAILTNSKATAQDVLLWTAAQRIPLRTQPQPIPIGTGFARPLAEPLPETLRPGDYVLFVSTIEVRKNHQQAFRIWCRMLQEIPRDQIPTLVFAGSKGWMVDDLMKAIESTNYLDGKLVLIEGPDDATLAGLYQSCRFTLFLSYYEGWGLPVSDSLAFGKVCVSSNRSSMPEAGREFCVYVDPDNTTSAYSTVRRLIEHPDELRRIEMRLHSQFKPTAWSSTATSVIDAALGPGRL